MTSAGAYPRSRGGTHFCSLDCLFISGLSPLARGNHAVETAKHKLMGPIPARAGEPRSVRLVKIECRAYPRSRGGTAQPFGTPRFLQGLSPLARENRRINKFNDPIWGPIPARAGEPGQRLAPIARARAYPRSRGGTNAGNYAVAEAQGLSPLARGNLGRQGFW